jgi:cobalt/nickel transport system permease protein
MHVPDGFFDAPTALAAGAVATAGIAVCLRGARRELAGDAGSAKAGGRVAGDRAGRADDIVAPMAGLLCAFLFAVQMLNFPVAAGTSGHLLGGVLAAVLVGPYTGALCVAVVLSVQAMFFADGGLTALGVNITTMSLITVVVGYAVYRGLVAVLPRRKASITTASGLAALVAVPAAALGFTGLYAIGGTTDVPLSTVAAAMVGVHVLIGIGEALITAATVASVLAVRPDLVYGAGGLRRDLELRTSRAAA